MRSDLYNRVVLTIIAGCLLVLTLQAALPKVRAAGSTTCTGEMRATSSSPIQASIGSSYKIEVRCE